MVKKKTVGKGFANLKRLSKGTLYSISKNPLYRADIRAKAKKMLIK